MTELKFDDGKLPSQEQIDNWLGIVNEFFGKAATTEIKTDFDDLE